MDELIDLHDQIIQRTGGTLGILNRGALDAAVYRARWGPFIEREDLAERAALLLRGIAQDHPFLDGNKRTAFAAAELVSRRNARGLEMPDDSIPPSMVAIAEGRWTIKQIAAWIRDHQQRD